MVLAIEKEKQAANKGCMTQGGRIKEKEFSVIYTFAQMFNITCTERAYLVAQMVKRLPAMRETWVRSLGREDPLAKEMATQFSILAWRIPWMEEPGRLQVMGLKSVGHN